MTIPKDNHQQDAFLQKLGIADPCVREAFSRVSREQFLPENMKRRAWEDAALPIGHDQTISQPSLVALMTQALQLTGEEIVLEIGTGSGYQTALLSCLAQKVISIERIPALARTAKKRLHALGYTNVTVRCGDGTKGCAKYAPYDAVLVTAGAPSIPTALVDQLKQGGRLVIPIGQTKDRQTLQIGIKKEQGIEMRSMESVLFVPLIGVYGWKRS